MEEPMATIDEKYASVCHMTSAIFKEYAPLITVLGDVTSQIIILDLLNAENTGLRVGKIIEDTNLSRPAVLRHIGMLKDAGVVLVRKCGTMNYYFLSIGQDKWMPLRTLVEAMGFVSKNSLDERAIEVS